MKIGTMVGHAPELSTIVASPALVDNSFVGVEVELEGVTNKLSGKAYESLVRGLYYWRATDDGSLRDGGIEFVLRQPLAGVDLINALEELELSIEQCELVPDCNERTSLHVHLDSRDMDVHQLNNTLLLYGIFERALLQYCHESRRNNNFCLPMYETPAFFAQYDPREPTGFANRAHGGGMRYSALNLASLAKFGSLEFRQHHGAWQYQEVLNWINILLSIRHFATDVLNSEDPRELILYFSEHGFMNTAAEVFGEYLPLLEYEGFEYDVAQGVDMMQDMAYLGQVSNTARNNMASFRNARGKGDLFLKYMERKTHGKRNSYEQDPYDNPQDREEYEAQAAVDEMVEVRLTGGQVARNRERERAEEIMRTRYRMTPLGVQVPIRPPVAVDEWLEEDDEE